MISSKRIFEWILLISGAGVAVYVTYQVISIILMMVAFGQYDTSSYGDLVENYNIKTKEIRELKRYINSITPSSKSVHIEFDSDESLGIFHVVDNGRYDSNWNIKVNSQKADSLLQKIGWNKQNLKELKEKLDAANCISVANSKPFQIGYQRSGMGMYFYNLFDNPLTDSLKTHYNDSCRYVIHTQQVVMEYGGGAVGPQCFPDFK